MTTIQDGISPHAVDTIRFEVRNGMRRVDCTISGEALDAASGLVAPSTKALRRQSFDRFRAVINAAAIQKLGTLPANFAGPLALSGDDLRGASTGVGAPLFGSMRRFR